MSKLKTRIVTLAIAGITELIGPVLFIMAGMFFGIGGMFFWQITLFGQPVIGADWLDRTGGRIADQALYLRRCSPPVGVSCSRWGSPVEKVARGWPVM